MSRGGVRWCLLAPVAVIRRTIAALFAMTALTVALVPAAPASTGALELVTPADPVGGTVQGAISITPGGDRIAYISVNPMPGAPAGDLLANNVATRGAGGWSTTPIGLPYEVESGSIDPVVRLMALSRDLLTTIWTSSLPVGPGSPPAGNFGLYRRGPGGQVELLADVGTSPSGFVGASEAADRVVFAATAHLLPSDAGRSSGESIYESTGLQPRQVDVAGDGALLSACGSTVPAANGVSRSGSRVFFVNPDPSTPCGGTSRVYLREGGTSTVEISASRCGRPDCNAEHDAIFAGATPDGGSAFLTTAQQLTDEDLDERADLYRYDVGSGALTLVSGRAAGAEGEATAEPVLVGDDGERVYFRAQGKLTAEGDPGGENLYLADAAGLHLVAAVAGEDLFQISADGRIALLDTTASLAAGDADGRRDVYRYDAIARTFAPVSFGPGFGDGPFDATIASVPAIDGEPDVRPLSGDGARLVFGTAEPLLAADGNGARDVYEWNGAAPELVSTGSGASDATLAGVSAGGGTVLFRTAAGLLPATLTAASSTSTRRGSAGVSPTRSRPDAMTSAEDARRLLSPATHPQPPVSREGRERPACG